MITILYNSKKLNLIQFGWSGVRLRQAVGRRNPLVLKIILTYPKVA